MERTLHYLKDLLNIPSPTGYTQQVIGYLKSTLEAMGYAPLKTAKGSLLLSLEGKEKAKHRLVTAHVDTLGAMVKDIRADGRLKLEKIGGFPWNMIEGENCLIHLSQKEKTLSGTILLHQTSTHVYKEAGTVERSQDNMEVRLDIPSFSKEQTKAYGVQVGDFVSFDPRLVFTEEGFVKSRFLDDKVSVAIFLSLLEKYKKDDQVLPVSTHFLFSVFEEVGFGGNSSIPSEVVEYLAVDMGAMGDGQQTDEYTVSICAKDASGPYHYAFRQHLINLAETQQIPYKIDLYPYYGSDASAAIRSGVEVKHALLGAGIESSHSYERTHKSSIQATWRLVDAYLQSSLVEE